MAYRKDLLMRQKRLLNRFYRAYNPHEHNETPEIQSIRSEYNWLVDQVQQYPPRPQLPDPFEVLPPEILLQCFSEVPHDRSDGLFALLQVSRKWRFFLMSASSFWTQIFLGQGAGNRRRVEMALLYSQQAPLTLEIFLQPQQEGWWVDLLSPHADRIREVHFRHHALYDGDYNMREHLFPEGLRALRRLSTCLPALETLAYVNGQQSYLPKISGEELPYMPALRTMIGFDLGQEILTLSTFPASKLTRFSTSTPIRDLVPLLYQCTQLEHLALEETYEITRAFGERIEVIDESIEVSQLPALKMFSFTRNNVAAVRPILSQRGFNIIELHLKLRWFDMADLSYLGELPHLIHFRIYHPVERTDNQTPPPSFPPLLRIKKLDFMQQPDMFTEPMPVPTNRFEQLFRELSTNLPRVETLSLHFYESPPIVHLVGFIGSLKLLQNLHVSHGDLQRETGLKRHTIPSLNSVRLSNEHLLHYLELPALKNLWIDAVASDANQAMSSSSSTDVGKPLATSPAETCLDGRRFSHVATLTWDGSISWGNLRQCSTITTGFASITKLVFAEAYARKDSNDFCAALIRSPTSCPHLTNISFHCYPSWDLLFHMLLRRNIMPGSPVTPLKNIQLPGYPARSLLLPLTGLLASKLSTIPAMSEIALTFRNGLFDSSKAGCDCCMDCGLSCQVPVQVIDPLHVVTAQPNLLGDSPEDKAKEETPVDDSNTDTDCESTEIEYNLIEPLKAWFDTWPQRRKAWNEYSESWGLKYRRSFACGKHDFVNLVTITGSMLRETKFMRER
ncbi:hypothetical protein FRC19_004362 [Serendipita sp. 401]|nr:hypothetical protein FRC19_004362 [Serendipita sp. 401]